MKITNHKDSESTFYSLIQLSIREQFTPADREVFSHADWNRLYQYSKEQSLLGITYNAIRLIPNELKPPEVIFLKWYGNSKKIETKNKLLNDDAVCLCQKLTKDGFQYSLLKGQGLGMLYPYPLLRSAGDIDVWIDGSTEDIIKYVRREIPDINVDISKKHIEFPIFDETIVELHFYPSLLASPRANKKLQAFYQNESKLQFRNVVELPDNAGAIYATTVRFNAIHVLVHIFGHYFYEGIGLKQFLDYYYVLVHLKGEDREIVINIIKSIGLLRFTDAVMYVLQKVFAIPQEKMLTRPNAKLGEKLLQDVMKGGNFGKNSDLVKSSQHNSAFYRFVSHTKRQFINIEFCPEEMFWSPWSRVKTFIWRKKNGYFKKI